MTIVDAASPLPSDAELLARVRGGDFDAYGDLFGRHRDSANRLARQLTRGDRHDADDLVSEAFAKVLSVLKSGRGPDVFFRAYLLQAIRHVHVDRIRAGQRVQLTDEVEMWESPLPFQDSAVDEFERSAAARAFASLPDRWQMVLWHLDVEGQKPAEVGVLLGLSANGVSALAYRAREGLRTAFLRMHLADTAGDSCRWTVENLGAYVRSGLSRRDAGKVKDHLGQCPRCAGLYEELAEVNGNLRGLLAPLLLGSAAVAYVQAGTLAGATGSVLSGITKLVAVLSTPAQAVTAGGTAAATAAAAVTVGVVGGVSIGRLPTDPSAAAPATSETVSGATSAMLSPDDLGQAPLDQPGGSATFLVGPDTELSETSRPRGPDGATPSSRSSPSALPTSSGSATVTDPLAPLVPAPSLSTSTASPTPTPTPIVSPTPTIVPTPTPTPTPTIPVPPIDPSPTTPVPTTPTTPEPTPPDPTTPVPSTAPTTPVPPTGTASDLSVSMYSAPPDATGVRVSISVEATQPGSDFLLTVELPSTGIAQSQSPEWTCSTPLNPSSWSCAAPGNPLPPPLVLIVQPGLQGGQLSATVSAPGNEDPDPSDNTAMISIGSTVTAAPSSESAEPAGASDAATR